MKRLFPAIFTFVLSPVWAGEDIHELQIREFLDHAVQLKEINPILFERLEDEILGRRLEVRSYSQNQFGQPMTIEGVPEDFPEKFLTVPLNFDEGVLRLREMLDWHSALTQGTNPNRLIQKSFEQLRPYYPKFNLAWNRANIHTQIYRLIKEIPELETEIKKSLKDSKPAWLKDADQTVLEAKKSSLEMWIKAMNFIQDSSNQNIFSRNLIMNDYDLDRALKEHFKMQRFKKRLAVSRGLLRSLSDPENCPPELASALESLFKNADDVFRQSKNSKIVSGGHFNKKRFFKGSRGELPELLESSSTDETGIEWGESEVHESLVISEISGQMMDQLRRAWEEQKNKIVFADPSKGDGMRIPVAPDARKFYEAMTYLDNLRRYHDRYYDMFRKLQDRYIEIDSDEREPGSSEFSLAERYQKFIIDRKSPKLMRDKPVMNYFSGELRDLSRAPFDVRRFLNELGIKSGALTAKEKDLSYLFPRPINQEKTLACVSFSVAADMSATYKARTGKDVSISPWLTHAINRGYNFQSRGKSPFAHVESAAETLYLKGITLKGEHTYLPMNFSKKLPDNMASHWKQPEMFSDAASGVEETYQAVSVEPTAPYEAYREPGFPTSLNSIKDRRFVVDGYAHLEPSAWAASNPLGVDFDFFRILIDNKMAPAVHIDTDESFVSEGWTRLGKKAGANGLGHAINVVGYGEEGLDPFDLRKKRYLIVRNSMSRQEVHFKIDAEHLITHLIAVSKAKDVREISSPSPNQQIVKLEYPKFNFSKLPRDSEDKEDGDDDGDNGQSIEGGWQSVPQSNPKNLVAGKPLESIYKKMSPEELAEIKRSLSQLNQDLTEVGKSMNSSSGTISNRVTLALKKFEKEKPNSNAVLSKALSDYGDLVDADLIDDELNEKLRELRSFKNNPNLFDQPRMLRIH